MTFTKNDQICNHYQLIIIAIIIASSIPFENKNLFYLLEVQKSLYRSKSKLLDQ